jgi:hypothetical protein
MSNKAAIAAIAILALAAVAFVPMADMSADEQEIVLTADSAVADSEGQSENQNSLFYDCLIVLIIVLIAAGALHVRAHPRK